VGATGQLAVDGGTPVRSEPLHLGKGVALLGQEERAAVLEVLESRSLFRYYGPNLLGKVAAFEDAVRSLLGAPQVVATSSGTAALRVALAALGVGCGDEVIVPAFTFIATVNAVVTAGAVPVFAEVDESLGLDPADLQVRITERTAAVIPVHLENVAADMDPILQVSRSRGVLVLEDVAQSMGASYRGRALGTLGDMGAFSLQLEKNVTAGEGGAVTTADEHLYLRAARYQDQGGQFITSHGGERGEELVESFVGENLRMTEIAGAIAGVQLGRLPGLLESMRANHRHVAEGVGDFDGLVPRRIPDPEGDGGSSLTWFLPSKDIARRFIKSLRAEGIPCAQFYGGRPVYAAPSILQRRTATGKGGPWNCAEHPCDIEYEMGMCPRTEDLAARNVLVPIGAAFTKADCDDAVEGIRKVATAVL
jgi:8-amino-3,8-dideoxy-alpha-D-manno-octulosonate transaminase